MSHEEEMEQKQLEEAKEQIKGLIKAGQRINVQEAISVHLGDEDGPTRGWLHTHGMWELFELPDLEIVGVRPLYMLAAAGQLVNHVAQYMIDSLYKEGALLHEGVMAKPVKLGQKFATDRLTVLQFEQATCLDKSSDNLCIKSFEHRWRLVEVPGVLTNPACPVHGGSNKQFPTGHGRN